MPNDKKKDFRKREPKEFDSVVVSINRVSKTVKGGRRMRFAALVVVGDHKGRIGFGMGKAAEVPDAIKKAEECATKNVFNVKLVDGTRTVPHTIKVTHVHTKPSKVEGKCDVCGSDLVQRKDDTVEQLKVRMDEYEKSTKPVIDFYAEKGVATRIDAARKPEEVFGSIKEVLSKIK